MRTIGQALVILALTAVAATATNFWHPRAPAWYLNQQPLGENEVTLADIEARWKGEVLWIDARLRSEYDAGHVPGALLLNEQEADQLMFEHFEKLQDNKKPLIVYCSGAACQASRKMMQYLKDRLPIEEIYVLRGGWAEAQKVAPD